MHDSSICLPDRLSSGQTGHKPSKRRNGAALGFIRGSGCDPYMAPNATPFRVEVELSDVDRSKYASLELRPARHPSESMRSLVTRTLAYCLSYEDGIEICGTANLAELRAEASAGRIHRAGDIDMWTFAASLLDAVEARFERNLSLAQR